MRKVKFTPEEMAYEAPADVSHLKFRRAYPNAIVLDKDVAKVFKDSTSVNNALRKLIEAVPAKVGRRKASA